MTRPRLSIRTVLLATLGATLAVSPAHSSPPVPVSGRPVPELEIFDDEMIAFMQDKNIESGVLGIMKEGRIVYLRGFGELDDGVPLPENAMFRIASISKPITAAAIRTLIADGDFSINSRAFNLGQPGGGLLNISPFIALGDERLKDVTINHLLLHRAGWNMAAVGDVTYMERDIATDMNVESPPGRENTMSWILGQPLQFTPGQNTHYSNVGGLALGLIVEQRSGTDLLSYIYENVLTPDMGVPTTELQLGRTFRDWRHPREPWYRDLLIVPNVFDNYGNPIVQRPYGGWDQEARIGQGGMIASAMAMLHLADRYIVHSNSTQIGAPVSSPPAGGLHLGGLWGSNTLLMQRPDRINVYIAFNTRPNSGHYGDQFRQIITPIIDSGTLTWPETTSDGFWVQPDDEGNDGFGGFHAPYRGLTHTLDQVTEGSRVRLHPGVSQWTGTIETPMHFDAPLGDASIGGAP